MPIMLSDSTDDVKELITLFDDAERYMKKVEVETGDFFAPSTNELRYAFYHYLKYQTTKEDCDYSKTKNHILRATYDAKEVILMTFMEKIKDFEDKYVKIPISDVIGSDWVKTRKTLNEIKELISDKNFKENNSDFDKAYDALKDIIKTNDAAVPELDKKLDEFIKTEKYKMKQEKYIRITIILAMLTIIVSVIIAA